MSAFASLLANALMSALFRTVSGSNGEKERKPRTAIILTLALGFSAVGAAFAYEAWTGQALWRGKVDLRDAWHEARLVDYEARQVRIEQALDDLREGQRGLFEGQQRLFEAQQEMAQSLASIQRQVHAHRIVAERRP